MPGKSIDIKVLFLLNLHGNYCWTPGLKKVPLALSGKNRYFADRLLAASMIDLSRWRVFFSALSS
jgi:hypothetical protein